MPRHPVLETRQVPGSRRAESRRGKEFGLALGTSLPARRGARLARQAHTGSSFVSVRGPEGRSCLQPAPRRTRCRISDRVMDPGADRHSNLAPVSCPLPSPRDLAALADDGLELPETRAARMSTRRSGDCALAALPLAAYKKRLHGWGRTWFSWTRAAFCSSPISSALGPQKDRHPTVRCATNKARSMRSVPWRCRPGVKEWLSTHSFTPARSAERKWWSFFKLCFAICVVQCSYYGIVARFIVASWSRTFCTAIRASIRNTFLPMRQNSIRLSTYGTEPMMSWLTALPKMKRISNAACSLACVNFGPRSRCSGPVSMLLSYPGLAKQAFLSFDETQ